MGEGTKEGKRERVGDGDRALKEEQKRGGEEKKPEKRGGKEGIKEQRRKEKKEGR